MQPLPFSRMNGLGNTFVIVDGRQEPVRLSPDQIRRIADPATGPGCDQFIAMERSPAGADVWMRIVNADGGEVESCGNAARCIAALVAGETGRDTVAIETRGGLLAAVVNPDGTVTVDMGRPRFRWDEIPLAEEFHDTRTIEVQIGPIDAPVLHSPSVVNVGNPHAIFWVDDTEAYDLARLGPMIENHPMFPNRINVSLARITGAESMVLRVWERGAGLTRACGTAACAAAVAAARKQLTGRSVTVTLPGGPLHIEWRESDDHILMTGPVAHEEDGVLDAALLAEPAV
jgi:diaminopimelate epimerase